MIKLSWRKKLFLLAVCATLIPIGISSYRMIDITQDELKTNVNNDLILTTDQVAHEINDVYTNNWLAPLLLIKSGLENEDLGAGERISFLTAGIENIEDIVSLAVYFELQTGKYTSALETTKDVFKDRLRGKSPEAAGILTFGGEEIAEHLAQGKPIGNLVYIDALDTWLTGVTVPLKIPDAPPAVLAARVKLDRIEARIENHPFNQLGRLYLIDEYGNRLFQKDPVDLSGLKVVSDAKRLLKSRSRIQSVTSYHSPEGENLVGSYAFPLYLDWGVIAEIAESKAYAAVSKMRQTMFFWVLIGVILAGVGVIFLSRQISKPILRISKAADEIAAGNFDVKVDYKAQDEIGQLAQNLMNMSGSLKTSFLKIEKQNKALENYSRTLEDKVVQRTQEIRQQADELETLDDIVRAINREVTLKSVLNTLLKQSMKFFPQAEKGAFLIRDTVRDDFKFAAVEGYRVEDFSGIRLTSDEALKRYTRQSDQIEEKVYIVRKSDALSGQEKFKNISVPKSMLAMAVVLKEKLEGFFVLDNFQDPDAFDNSDLEKLKRFHQHAISAISKARNLANLQSQNKELDEKNKELIRTQEQLVLQEKLASLGQLTAGIAHEIKNPLNFVNNFSVLSIDLVDELKEELQSVKVQMDDETREVIEEIIHDVVENAQKIAEHGSRADSIVRSMLHHSRKSSGELESVDLNKLLDEYINLAFHGMRAQDPAFNVSIEKNFDESIGMVNINPQAMSRVLLNITNNGFYATRAKSESLNGDYSPEVSFTTNQTDENIEIKIRDNGTGIPPHVREKIFNPFYTTKPTGDGTGLGLSISYDIIVQIHKGDIKVNSKEGEFTEFVIRFPKERDPSG